MIKSAIYQPPVVPFLVDYAMPEEDWVFTRVVEASDPIEARHNFEQQEPLACILTVKRLPAAARWIPGVTGDQRKPDSSYERKVTFVDRIFDWLFA